VRRLWFAMCMWALLLLLVDEDLLGLWGIDGLLRLLLLIRRRPRFTEVLVVMGFGGTCFALSVQSRLFGVSRDE
jgi:hypothetical protein